MHAIPTLEALLLASDEPDELIELDARLLRLDLLLPELAVLEKVDEFDEAFELESDEKFNELFAIELTSDDLETLVAAVLDLLELEATEDRLDKENELAEEEIFDELLLIAALEFNVDEERELNTILTEETELDTVLDTELVTANEELFELDPATTKDEIELLLFSATLTLELAAELINTATELTLTFATELLLELGGGGEEALPAPPPQALSSKDTTTIFPTKKYNWKPSTSLELLRLNDMTVLVKY